MKYNANGLTDNQQVFADEYLVDRNATRAYKVAYPRIKNDNSASTAGARLLRNVRVSAYVKAAEAAMHDASIADAREVRCFLTSVMRGQVTEPVPLLAGSGFQELVDAMPGVSPRIRAAELLGKLMGLYTDQVHVSMAQMPKIIRGGDGSVEIDAGVE